ncbi:RHTO0S07e04830g1_1 [Rhodotorula toruloides]|uniref:RHTO0S07e04830g1_1 n=1 Tax=Rhodotorula toruloides TaxID=5286 RepID=A0A061AYV8_RHOTO|nr:RHTO0S07e04830g1_1 [Rhodotorula toruloides]
MCTTRKITTCVHLRVPPNTPASGCVFTTGTASPMSPTSPVVESTSSSGRRRPCTCSDGNLRRSTTRTTTTLPRPRLPPNPTVTLPSTLRPTPTNRHIGQRRPRPIRTATIRRPSTLRRSLPSRLTSPITAEHPSTPARPPSLSHTRPTPAEDQAAQPRSTTEPLLRARHTTASARATARASRHQS